MALYLRLVLLFSLIFLPFQALTTRILSPPPECTVPEAASVHAPGTVTELMLNGLQTYTVDYIANTITPLVDASSQPVYAAPAPTATVVYTGATPPLTLTLTADDCTLTETFAAGTFFTQDVSSGGVLALVPGTTETVHLCTCAGLAHACNRVTGHLSLEGQVLGLYSTRDGYVVCRDSGCSLHRREGDIDWAWPTSLVPSVAPAPAAPAAPAAEEGEGEGLRYFGVAGKAKDVMAVGFVDIVGRKTLYATLDDAVLDEWRGVSIEVGQDGKLTLWATATTKNLEKDVLVTLSANIAVSTGYLESSTTPLILAGVTEGDGTPLPRLSPTDLADSSAYLISPRLRSGHEVVFYPLDALTPPPFCYPCADDHYRDRDTAKCTICPAGHFCDGWSTHACPAGTYQPATGAVSALACLPCLPPLWTDDGRTECTYCETGYYCVGATIDTVPEEHTCEACSDLKDNLYCKESNITTTLQVYRILAVCPVGSWISNAPLRTECTSCSGTYSCDGTSNEPRFSSSFWIMVFVSAFIVILLLIALVGCSVWLYRSVVIKSSLEDQIEGSWGEEAISIDESDFY